MARPSVPLIVPRPDMTYQIARGSESLTRVPHETHGSERSLGLRAPLSWRMSGQPTSLLPSVLVIHTAHAIDLNRGPGRAYYPCAAVQSF